MEQVIAKPDAEADRRLLAAVPGTRLRTFVVTGCRVQAGPSEVRDGLSTRRLLEFTLRVLARDEAEAFREFERRTGVEGGRLSDGEGVALA